MLLIAKQFEKKKFHTYIYKGLLDILLICKHFSGFALHHLTTLAGGTNSKHGACVPPFFTCKPASDLSDYAAAVAASEWHCGAQTLQKVLSFSNSDVGSSLFCIKTHCDHSCLLWFQFLKSSFNNGRLVVQHRSIEL